MTAVENKNQSTAWTNIDNENRRETDLQPQET